MKDDLETKTLGQAIDEVIAALLPLSTAMRTTAIHAACEHLKMNLPSQAGVMSVTETPGAVTSENQRLMPTPSGSVSIVDPENWTKNRG